MAIALANGGKPGSVRAMSDEPRGNGKQVVIVSGALPGSRHCWHWMICGRPGRADAGRAAARLPLQAVAVQVASGHRSPFGLGQRRIARCRRGDLDGHRPRPASGTNRPHRPPRLRERGRPWPPRCRRRRPPRSGTCLSAAKRLEGIECHRLLVPFPGLGPPRRPGTGVAPRDPRGNRRNREVSKSGSDQVTPAGTTKSRDLYHELTGAS
jgi:hypothetical protein